MNTCYNQPLLSIYMSIPSSSTFLYLFCPLNIAEVVHDTLFVSANILQQKAFGWEQGALNSLMFIGPGSMNPRL